MKSKINNAIFLLTTLIWLALIITDLTSATIEVPLIIEAMLGVVAGYFFKPWTAYDE